MEQDLNNLEDELKKKAKPKKKIKQSGRSVFGLQEIIKKKSQKKNESIKPRESI